MSAEGDGEAGQVLDESQPSQGAERNEERRSKGARRGKGHGDAWKKGGGKARGRKRIFILGDAPQVKLPDAKGVAEHCILCWEEQPSYVSIGRCRHAEVCWVCTLRLRFLNQDTRCPLCNEELGEVLLTNDRNASVTATDLIGLNHERPWIYFADDVIRRAVLQLLGYRCQIEGCAKKDSGFKTLRQLEEHLWWSHWRQLCKVCLYDRSAFVCEQRVYDSDDMQRHFWEGDTDVMVEQKQMPTVPPHPLCEFCNERFFNEESLQAHMYRRHVLCQLCDSLGKKNEFYTNLKCLSRHYQEKHYVCAHKDCALGGYRQTAFAEEKALIEHYEKVHKQSFKDEKGKSAALAMGFFEEEPSTRRRKGSGRGSTDASDHVQFRWASTATDEDYVEAAGSEEVRDGLTRYPTRDIVPLRGNGWRAKESEEAQAEGTEEGKVEESQKDEEEPELSPELAKLGIECALRQEGPNHGAPSCLSALHAALRALVPENEAETGGWDVKLLPAVRRLNRAEVENLECMRIYLHDNESQEQTEESIDWEPLERLLGLRPKFYLLLSKANQPLNARTRQAIGPRKGPVEEKDEVKAWRQWKTSAQVVIQSLAPKAQQRLLRFVELCVQRRTALEERDEGVPDWEDEEEIAQEFPSLNDSAAGTVPPPEMGSLARHAKGWADIAAGHTREVEAAVDHFPQLGGGTATPARPSWGPRALPVREPTNGRAGHQPAPAAAVAMQEAFPSLGAGTAVMENTTWGASGKEESKEGPRKELTLEEWAKPQAKPAAAPKEFNATNAEAFPTLGGGSTRAPATWGSRPAAPHSAVAAKAAASKEARASAAAKEAADAIAEAKAARASKEKVEAEVHVNDTNNFPQLPPSSAPKAQAPKKMAKAKPTPKEKASSSAKVAKAEALEVDETMTPLHLDQDLVLLKKGDDEEIQAKEGSQKKKKGPKKTVMPASEWFQG